MWETSHCQSPVFLIWVHYADLNVKPGQTIRVLVSESCAGGNLHSYFPEILLKLQ